MRKQKTSTDDRLQVVLNRLADPSSKEITYDTETSGLDWRRNHICGYVVTFSPDPRDSYYVPVRHAAGGNIFDQAGPQTKDGWDGSLARGEGDLVKAIFRPGRRIVGHNLAFDLKFSYRIGGTAVFEPQFEDTIINEPLINEFNKMSLDECCKRRGVQAKKGEILYQHIAAMFPGENIQPTARSAMGHYWRLSGTDPIGVEYAVGDGTSTIQLRDAQRVEIIKPVQVGVDRDGQPVYTDLRRVHGVESRLIRVLARMTCRGIKVDVGYFEELRERLNRDISKMLQVFPDPDNASAQASSDVKWYMEKHGVTNWPLTPKTRKPSFPEKWLQQSEPGRDIIKIRRATHLRNSFINPLLEEHIWNGRVHANFNQLRGDEYGTITGRLSCDSPNLQQAHKRNEEMGRLLRGGFIPDDGMTFAEVDYSQCEPRLLAYYSRCRVLLDGYRAMPSIDAHTAVAAAMYHGFDKTVLDDKMHALYKDHKVKRENAKRVNQTLVTGGGKGVIVERYGVDPKEVDTIWNNYFKAMPEIRTLQKQAAARMQRRGFVTSLLGRRARLIDDRSYIAVNRLLQCGNADILKAKMVEIDDYLASEGRPAVDLLNNIHDAFDFQFTPECRKHYEHCLGIMSNLTEGNPTGIVLDVPMEVDAGEGPTWAVATFGEETK